MSDKPTYIAPAAPMTHVTDDAVGVPRAWYVAIVNHNNEINAASRLAAAGHESYVATQQEMRVRKSGRKVKVDRLVIPSKVFIRCTEPERRQIVTLPYVNRFMTNIAGTSRNGVSKPLVTIPESQMQTLRFMLGQADNPVAIVEGPFHKGQTVRVARGKLRGLTGQVTADPEGNSYLTVTLDTLGYARVLIDSSDLEPID